MEPITHANNERFQWSGLRRVCFHNGCFGAAGALMRTNRKKVALRRGPRRAGHEREQVASPPPLATGGGGTLEALDMSDAEADEPAAPTAPPPTAPPVQHVTLDVPAGLCVACFFARPFSLPGLACVLSMTLPLLWIEGDQDITRYCYLDQCENIVVHLSPRQRSASTASCAMPPRRS